MSRRPLSIALVFAATTLALAGPAPAQTGFTLSGAERLADREARLAAAIEADSLSAWSRTLSARPHVAGSPEQAAVAETLAVRLRRAGLQTEIVEYRVFLPWPTAVSLSVVAPDTVTFTLSEPPVPGDPATVPPQYPWVNGYAAPGRVEAEAIYANYGLHEDYRRLDSLDVTVAGKVVVARYGHSYRGIKARLAERRGAAALLLFSDPADDGFARGDIYPDGPFRPWHGVERGSVMNGVGDPTTPGRPSRPGAPRVDPRRSWHELPGIPVVPVSYAVAAEILSRLGGGDLPDPQWQGGLPFRYHVGPGPVRLRLHLEDDREGSGAGMKPVRNVIARIEGREWPDEVVVVGAHIDAWGPGALDNVSGTVSVLAAARAFAAVAAADGPPRRTVVFAGWDAEEWGLIGSTEWVEEHADELFEGGVAYINQDAIGGTRFRAAASPSLKPMIRSTSAAIRLEEGRTLQDVWVDAAPLPPSEELPAPPIGDLGGGSDYAGFANHLGIPSINHGFGTSGGVYHSGYDTWKWMARFGDPGFVHHALSSRLAAVLALRLADAEILPYDHVAFAEELGARWDELRTMAEERGLLAGSAAAALDAAWDALAERAAAFASVRDRYLRGGTVRERSRRSNAALRRVERAFVRQRGLDGRPWYRHLAFASDPRNGYATLALPAVAEAIRAGDPAALEEEIADLARRVRSAEGHLAEALASLASIPSRD